MAVSYRCPPVNCNKSEPVIWCNAVAAGASCSYPKGNTRRKKPIKIEKVIIHADGASRGNPGPAGIGATIKDEHGILIASVSRAIGIATNNQAEYRAVIAALEEAIRLGASHVDICLDSQLVVRQVKGEYRVKNRALKPLYQRVKQLLSQLKGFNIRYITSQQNRESHKLANIVLK